MNNCKIMVTCVRTWQTCCQQGLLGMLLVLLIYACPWTEGTVSPAKIEPRLEICPLHLAEIRSIIPLGNLNPRGGHVFPTDHMYLDYGHREGLPVRAATSGRVFAIRRQMGDDFKIEIQVNERFSYYIAHVLPVKGMGVGSTVKSGEVIGYTSGRSLLDLGCVDSEVTLKGFVNPDRYPESTVHCVSPSKLYEDPLRRQLYSKVLRDSTDKDGRIDYDIAGHLVGNWFLEGLSVADSSRGSPAIWAKQLAFAYDVHEPNARRASIGGTVAPAGLYWLSADSPDPAEVNVKSGSVRLILTDPVPRDADSSHRKPPSALGVLLVQMLTPSRVKVEFFPSQSGEGTMDFSESARIYER
jgi:hypothetical protein